MSKSEVKVALRCLSPLARLPFLQVRVSRQLATDVASCYRLMRRAGVPALEARASVLRVIDSAGFGVIAGCSS